MDMIVIYFVLVCGVLQCKSHEFREQWEENIMEKRDNSRDGSDEPLNRRSFVGHQINSILGAPGMPSHLPEAEPILPGHTLLRPAMGMLKSAVKFPHKELENGAGVYGNINNLGIRYDGRNERVLYSGFRRTNLPAEYIVVAPLKTKSLQPKFILSSVVLDLDRDQDIGRNILKAIRDKRSNRNAETKRIVNIYTSGSPATKKSQSPKRLTMEGKMKPFKNILYYKTSSNQDRKKALRFDDHDDSRELIDTIDEEEVKNATKESVEVDIKKEWFWNTKNSFNHIKLSQDAPEYSELVPDHKNFDSIRKWWFFNQVDFQPFKNSLE